MTSPVSNPQIQNDPVSVAETMMQQNGGDAKAAFYALAKQKGVDPNAVLDQINSMGNPKQMIQNMIMQNPRIGGLMRLFGGMR